MGINSIMARLHIRHTRVTRSYLLNREDQPVSQEVTYFIKHVLVECSVPVLSRRTCYCINNTCVLFEKAMMNDCCGPFVGNMGPKRGSIGTNLSASRVSERNTSVKLDKNLRYKDVSEA